MIKQYSVIFEVLFMPLNSLKIQFGFFYVTTYQYHQNQFIFTQTSMLNHRINLEYILTNIKNAKKFTTPVNKELQKLGLLDSRLNGL